MTRSLRALAVLTVLSLFAGGCAYYNTFFHARQFYRQAEKARADAPGERRADTGLDLYEKAMQKCAKVILEYPDSRWVDDAILLMGKCFYAKEDFLAALRKFDEILLYYDKSNLRREARFRKAETLVALERYDEAVPILAEFREGKKDDLRAGALYLLAVVEFQRENYAAAADGFELYLAQEKGREDRDLVLLRLGESFRETGRNDKAEQVYRRRLDNPLLPADERLKTALDLSEALIAENRYDDANRVLDDIRSEIHSINDSLRVELYEGKVMLAEGRKEDAVDFYRNAMVGAPATDAVGRMAYTLGEIYLYDYDNKDSAAASYRRAVAGMADGPMKDDATQKSRYLGDWLDMKQQYAEGGADTARVHFLLAENDLFFFDQPDSALMLYRHVSDGFPKSAFAPRALAARATILEAREGREAESDSLLGLLVRRYPKSLTAMEVMDRGMVAVDPDSLAAWTALYEEQNPETTAVAVASGAEAGTPIEDELIPLGSEGSLLAEGEDIVFSLEGPPAPLRVRTTADPVYPLTPGGERPRGHVEVEVEVSREGKVENVRILRSSAEVFEGPALAAAYQYRYMPENVNGTRTTSLEFDFRPGP